MYGKSGQPLEGLKLLAEALEFMNKSSEFYHEAELYRLRGILRLQHNPQNALEAEDDYHKAIKAARRMSAKMCELRATTSLCRLWQSQENDEKFREALGMLSDVYNWFTEGFETRDLLEAQALLDALP